MIHTPSNQPPSTRELCYINPNYKTIIFEIPYKILSYTLYKDYEFYDHVCLYKYLGLNLKA